jgi:hypothetical protein
MSADLSEDQNQWTMHSKTRSVLCQNEFAEIQVVGAVVEGDAE